MANEIRARFVFDTKGASRELKNLGKESGFVSKQVSQVSATLAKFAGPAALGAIGAGIIKATKDTINLGSSLVDLSARTGLSIQQLQEFKFAAEQTGVGFESITGAVQRLGRRAAAELPEAVKGLEAIGLASSDIIELAPGDAFQLVVDRLSELPNAAQQSAAAMGIFGDAGLQITGLINQGLQDNIDRFRDLDVAMSDDTAQAAKKLSDDLTDLNARWTDIKTTVGSVVIPALNNIIVFFGDILPGAIQKASAFVIDFFATMVEQQQKGAAVLALFSDKFVGLADLLGNTARELRAQADAANDAAEANFIAATSTGELSSSAASATTGMTAFASATRAAASEVADYDRAVQEAGINSQGFFQGLQATVPVMAEASIVTNQATERFSGLQAVLPGVASGEQAVATAAMQASEGTQTLGGALGEAQSLMNAFGVESDSTAGKIVALGQTAISIFNSVLGLLDSLIGGMGGLGSALGGLFGGGGGGGLGGLFGGLFGGGGGLGGLGALFTNPITALIGGGIAGAFGLSQLFGREGSAETTAESIGIDFDALSSDLQNQLQQVGEQVGDFATGIQLNIGEVISQLLAGGQINLDQGLEKIVDTLSFVERGQIDTATASQVLQDAIAQILPRMDELGAGGVEQLQRLIGASQAFGVEFDGLQEIIDFVNEKLGQTADTGQAAAEAAGNAIGSEIAAGAQSAGVSVEQLIESMKELRNLSGGLGSGAFPGGLPRSLPVTGAQHGFDGIVNRPRLFMAGEGNLAERVTVTPLSGGGRGGGGSVTINLQIANNLPEGSPESIGERITPGLVRTIRSNPEVQRLIRDLGGEG